MKSTSFVVAGASALLVMSTSFLAAQQQSPDTARVDPVVVSATRVPISRGALPVAVTVITADDLRVKGITTVADALRDVTSAYVAQAGSQGATTSLFLRGGESKYVKVLVDGVPANDPGGRYDFASLTTDNVERIEIVRGPASVIHGADAVTGVVHVITRGGRGPAHVEVDVRTGMAPRARIDGNTADNMTTVDVTGSVLGELASASYSIGIGRHQSSGLYSLNNRYQNNAISGRFQFEPDDRTAVRFALRYHDYQYNYPTDGGGNVVDNNANRTEDRMLFGFEAERELSSAMRAVLMLNSSVNDGGTDDRPDAPGGSSFVSIDKVRRRSAELRVHLLPAAFSSVTVGAQLEQQDQRSQFQSQSPFGPFNSNFTAARRNAGLYAEVVLTSVEQVTATVGARLDDNERFGRFTTGRVGLSWRPLATTRLRATAGNAFREPSFLENYSTGFVLGNPDLVPERTVSWDAGIDHDLLSGRARVSVTGFAQRFVNMIDYESTNSACGFSYCNVAKATSNGVEAELRARVRGPWWASAGATLLKTNVVEPGYDSTSGGLYRRGESLIRRPERKVTGELSYRSSGPLSASLRVLAVGVRRDRDFRTFPATPVTLPSYEQFDLGAEYRLPVQRTRSALTFRVENLTDVRYQSVFNFLTPRRTVSFGVRATL